MRKLRTTTLCVALLLSLAGPAVAQTDKGQMLAANFQKAFGDHFSLVKSEFKSRTNEQGGGTFWLAYIKPKQTGYYRLQYRHKYNDPLYSHVEREINITVGPKGCRRGVPYAGTYSKFCLGDTIIFPVRLDKFTEHQFKLARFELFSGEDQKATLDLDRQKLNEAEVPNPAAASLRYLGYSSHKLPHRRPGYTLELYADFEATAPGRFNLLVTSSTQNPAAGETPAGGIPIIVVARDTPVTLIAGYEYVRGFSRGFDSRDYESSSSGNSYMTNLFVLQPGDRISLKYYSVVRGPEWERGKFAGLDVSDPFDDVKPVIGVHPFALETKFDYSSWLMDYLPE